jgi:transcriptional regulator with XRE-family HTH domain
MADAEQSLGEIIRHQRELADLSVREFARHAGISNPYLSQIERGLREPSERVLDAIAGSLRTTTDALYEQAGIERDAEDEASETLEAIRSDERLTGRQRQALAEMYEAFVAANDAPRKRRRR